LPITATQETDIAAILIIKIGFKMRIAADIALETIYI
jgi:hypothetical protein